jgi:hypothetical protein
VGQRTNFDSGQEFSDSLQRLYQQLQRQNNQRLLAKLQARGLNNLTPEEKRQYLEALRQKPASG